MRLSRELFTGSLLYTYLPVRSRQVAAGLISAATASLEPEPAPFSAAVNTLFRGHLSFRAIYRSRRVCRHSLRHALVIGLAPGRAGLERRGARAKVALVINILNIHSGRRMMPIRVHGSRATAPYLLLYAMLQCTLYRISPLLGGARRRRLILRELDIMLLYFDCALMPTYRAPYLPKIIEMNDIWFSLQKIIERLKMIAFAFSIIWCRGNDEDIIYLRPEEGATDSLSCFKVADDAHKSSRPLLDAVWESRAATTEWIYAPARLSSRFIAPPSLLRSRHSHLCQELSVDTSMGEELIDYLFSCQNYRSTIPIRQKGIRRNMPPQRCSRPVPPMRPSPCHAFSLAASPPLHEDGLFSLISFLADAIRRYIFADSVASSLRFLAIVI